MSHETTASHLKMLDRRLIDSLKRALPPRNGDLGWFNQSISKRFKRAVSDSIQFERFFAFLEQKGLFTIKIEHKTCFDRDGERKRMTLARAASTDMWPMGTHYWLRDNAIIGARFLRSGDTRQKRIGLALLNSGLAFISSCAQLDRFRTVIRAKRGKVRNDSLAWPHIFAAVQDNLMTTKLEPWAHKQDAWQILAWYILDCLEDGSISLSELSQKNRVFLGLIIPFLARVSFWRCENSGSWEELPAVRTSVRAWEHRLIVRLGELSKKREYSFIRSTYLRERRFMGKRFEGISLDAAVERLNRLATKAVIQDLPFESPSYDRRDPRYRRGDSALLYLLEIDYIPFLAEQAGKDQKWIKAMETKIVREVLRLRDPVVGGFARYKNDSYQRSGFFREETTARLRALYGGPSGDASSDFVGRDKIVPRGRSAVWTHFVWQLSAWAGRRFLASGDESFRNLHEEFFEQGMKLVTASTASIDYMPAGRARVIRISPYRMPECYIAERDISGNELIFPSPHTPLNWSVAEMLQACQVHKLVLTKR